MSRFLLTIAIAGAALFVGHQLLARSRPQRAGFAAIKRKIMKRMMDTMPEDSPPKLVMSILPRLQEQNEQILALLKEQTDLLRQWSVKRWLLIYPLAADGTKRTSIPTLKMSVLRARPDIANPSPSVSF